MHGRLHAAFQPSNRRDVDDGAAARFPHLGYGVFCPQKRTLGVYIQILVPLPAGDLLHQTGSVSTGVVDQNVQFPEACDRGRHGSPPLSLAGDVQPDEEALADGFIDFGLGLAPFLFQHVSNDRFGPFPGKQLGYSCANTPRSSADKSGLAFQFHGFPPLLTLVIQCAKPGLGQTPKGAAASLCAEEPARIWSETSLREDMWEEHQSLPANHWMPRPTTARKPGFE